ncbi:MAG: PSD1 and planctomycete cytochrome C domain-containing protein, partial [Planctomycetes bacterium]|nr:PSD1 and planctomycete cytochrome C domain-containing protein [Planctomycetota bacterium]
PAIVPGKPAESLLIESLRYESYEMPPDGKLSDEVVDHFVRWIEMGAPDPRRTPAVASSPASTAVDDAKHWAFQPPILVDPPPISDSDWPRTEIDRFILGRLEEAGLKPSPFADRRAQLRRLAYDLAGLPPSADEFAAFDAVDADDAYQSAVDRWLASERFGERWGRHWLDIARYADTKGYVFQEDRNYPQAYTYRDWVIRALNEDMPYDRFVVAQLAADHLDDPSARPATGFLTLGRRFINNQHDIIDDRIDVVTRGLMGLTVACARCHDHKYDPITMSDYYALYGVFASSREPKEESAPLLLVDADKPSEPVIFLRGNPANRGDRVPRRFLACLSDGQPEAFQQGSGRWEMAQAIASEDNPLTARVWVNRVWLHLFGQGLVTTPSDFGARSDPPSHPELLDWLARRFMQEGWSTKWLVRQIVLSSVYRQASDERPDCSAVDPENRLLWRMNRRRLDLEALRDSLLVAAGRLDTTMGGPSVELTKEPFSTRRTVYAFIERQNLPGMFRTFDFAGPDTHSPQRPFTTVPQQALFLMNSPFAIEQATRLAARREVAAATTDQQRIIQLFRLALGREPSSDEVAMAERFLALDKPTSRPIGSADEATWEYGWGHYDEASKGTEFHSLPHFTGSAWQGGPELPDPALGWVMLNATGGHPGNDSSHAAIRRWISPRAGKLVVDGNLEHSSDQGDGVRGRLVSDHQGLLAEWTAHNGKTATRVESLDVQAGEIVDLITDCRSGPSFDGFRWVVTIRLEPGGESSPRTWDSAAMFRGPSPDPLDRWQRLAQVLLLTNEFAFID